MIPQHFQFSLIIKCAFIIKIDLRGAKLLIFGGTQPLQVVKVLKLVDQFQQMTFH